MGVSNPISSTERPVAQIIRTYVGETTGSDTEDRREIPKMTTLRSNMGWTVDHSVVPTGSTDCGPEEVSSGHIKPWDYYCAVVIIIAHIAIFILYANCIYMYLCISICVYIQKIGFMWIIEHRMLKTNCN